MMSSAMPSAKYSHAGSPLRLPKGMTATDGLSNGGSDLFSAGLADEEGGRLGRSAVTTLAEESALSLTSATKRMPFRDIVRISRWCSPLSPTAFLAALMRLVSVDSETIRPAVTVPDQKNQQVENLRLDRNM